MSAPMPLVIFHLKASMDKKTAMSMRKRRVIEQPTPEELTDTGWDSIRVQRSHGTGKLEREIYTFWQKIKKAEYCAHPTVTSKMFDPTDEETAMSPLPCFATKTLVIRSGTEVPAAKNVSPIT